MEDGTTQAAAMVPNSDTMDAKSWAAGRQRHIAAGLGRPLAATTIHDNDKIAPGHTPETKP